MLENAGDETITSNWPRPWLRFRRIGSKPPSTYQSLLAWATAGRSRLKLALDYNLRYNRAVTKLKIRSIGSSHGIILPKEILDRLKLGEGDELFVIEAAGELRLTPYNPDFEKLMDAARDIAKRYRNDLRAMAKL